MGDPIQRSKTDRSFRKNFERHSVRCVILGFSVVGNGEWEEAFLAEFVETVDTQCQLKPATSEGMMCSSAFLPSILNR